MQQATDESIKPNDTATPKPRVTRQHKFFSCNPDQTALFTVRPGISLDDALSMASCFLNAAVGITTDAAMDMDSNEYPNVRAAWGAAYLVQISKALVDAANMASMDESEATP